MLLGQNLLHLLLTRPQNAGIQNIQAGHPVDVAFDMYPGRIYHLAVDSIISVSDRVQVLTPSGNWPQNLNQIPQRATFPVRVLLDIDDDYPVYLGASGSIAVYAGGPTPINFLRGLLFRIESWLDYVL